MKVKQLDHINLTVANLEATIDWYGRVFGFEVVERDVKNGVNWAVIRSGEAMLCIYEHSASQFHDRFELAKRGTHAVSHFALRIEDADEWIDTMRREGITPSYGGVIEWPHSKAWYVNDPTGYEIEIACWQNDEVAFG